MYEIMFKHEQINLFNRFMYHQVCVIVILLSHVHGKITNLTV